MLRLACLVALASIGCSACGDSPVSPGAQSPAPRADAGAASSTGAPGAAGSPGAGAAGTAGSLASDAGSNAPAPPAGLACLASYYVGAPVSHGGAWYLRLPDGTERPWNDGLTKTYDQTLAAPDLKDMLSMPYAPGPITPVTTPNVDPGRIRDDVLAKATYGASASAVQAALVDVDFVGQTVKFHPLGAAALGRVSNRLKQAVAANSSLAAYVTGTLGGTFNWRVIANTTRMSPHSYGIAIDIVVDKSDYWEWEEKNGVITWTNQIPQAIVDAFEAEKFVWGGRWYHYDTMHFEYRPEMYDPGCRP